MSTLIANQVVHYALEAAIICALLVAIPFVRRAYKFVLASIPAKYRPMVQAWAKEAVQYVEQYVPTAAGEEKFAAAVQQVAAIVFHHKLNVPIQEIQGIVQDAYNALKAAELLPAPSPTPAPAPTPATQPNPQQEATPSA